MDVDRFRLLLTADCVWLDRARPLLFHGKGLKSRHASSLAQIRVAVQPGTTGTRPARERIARLSSKTAAHELRSASGRRRKIASAWRGIHATSKCKGQPP